MVTALLKIVSTQWTAVNISIFLLMLYLGDVYCESCPESCNCRFSEITENNTATCDWGHSSIHITWAIIPVFGPMFYIKPPDDYVNIITCHGTNFTCSDLPQFDIRGDKIGYVVLNMTSCVPGIMRCINFMYPDMTDVKEVVAFDMIGSYEMEDFMGLFQAKSFILNIRGDADLPLEILYVLPNLNKFEIVGGNLHLIPGVTKNKTNTNDISIKLDNNNITSLPDDIFNGAGLSKLLIWNNNIENITAAAFRGLDVLENVAILNDEKLKFLEPKAFSDKKYIQNINLENTGLETLSNEMFRGLKKLHGVTIKNNLVEMNLGPKMFAYLDLWSVEIINSGVSNLPEDLFEESRALHTLILSRNAIETLPPKIFRTTTALDHITLDTNKIRHIPKEIFSELKFLLEVDFSNNHISDLNRDLFSFNPNLKTVIFDRNNITELDLHTFNKKNLETLSVASNQINRIIVSSTLSLKITHLDLRNNTIEDVEDLMSNLRKMKLFQVELSGNKIKTIKENLPYESTSTSGHIDLTYNNITTIISDNSDSGLNKKRKSILYLANNPLECDCTVTTILKRWHEESILRDFEDIICANGEYLSTIKLYTLCNETDTLIALIGSSAVGALVIFIILGTIFIRRNDIWQCITNIFKRNTDNIREHQMKLDALKIFDVFISFAHQDGEFVADQLLPKLENDFNQNVCVHYRDWTVGELIPDQIIMSVESSRMTIIVLTEHFIESEWAFLEFRTAHNLSIQEGKPKVIIVLLDEAVTRNKKITSDLKSYIAVNSYLLWSDSDFWERLQKMLPKKDKKKEKKVSVRK